jgi:FtsP/CotA-like multicopper oxidase with cupredoxin domain
MNFKTFKKGVVLGVTILAICALSVPAVMAQPVPGGTLDPLAIPKYVQPLVIPPVMNNSGTADDYDIAVRQFQQQILPGGHWNAVSPACQADPTLCVFPATTVWSYGPAADPLPDSSGIPGGAAGLAPALNSQFNYPAFTVENTVNTTTTVDWINDLIVDPWENGCGTAGEEAGDCNWIPYLITGVVDQTLHWANPPAGPGNTDSRGTSQAPYVGPNPIIVHVHGAHVGPESDGYPEAWYLPNAANIPGGYATQGTLVNQYGTITNPAANPGVANFSYPNDQPSTTLWYHDHTLGMTRLNVYAGPAGFWLIRDNGGETGLGAGSILPGPAPVAGEDPNFVPADRAKVREIPIAIQDRSFNADGSLFYPDNRAFFEGVTPAQLQIPFIPDATQTATTPSSDISPIWNPEAFFNVMVVNVLSWPELEVAPAIYRFRLLNGCNSRFLNLSMFRLNKRGRLNKEIPFYQIGAEQSLLPQVVEIVTGKATPLTPGVAVWDRVNGPFKDQALLMGPAERADVLVDFRGLKNGTIIRMINTAPDAPFGGFPDVPADPSTSGQVMQFRVNSALLGASPTDPGGATSATNPWDVALSLPDATDPANGPVRPAADTRDLALLEEESATVCATVNPMGNIVEVTGAAFDANDPTVFINSCTALGGFPFAPKAAVLGVNGSGGPLGAPGGAQVQLWSDPIAQNPDLDSTETWELWNWSADAHPIHLHLVKFKVVNREPIGLAGNLLGPVPPEADEAGWKDTVIAYPGEVTRLNATFDIDGLYVWHCHIVEHEDNEMMVPYCVGDKATAPGCNVVP